MDYSKVKFVKPSVDGKYFTKGKVYAVINLDGAGGYLIDDNGDKTCVYFPECPHLGDNPWIPCHEDGTPLTEGLTALEAEMLAMLEDIHSELIHGETPHAYKIEELIKKAKQ